MTNYRNYEKKMHDISELRSRAKFSYLPKIYEEITTTYGKLPLQDQYAILVERVHEKLLELGHEMDNLKDGSRELEGVLLII